MGEGHLNVFPFQMNDRVGGILGDLLGEKIEEPVFGGEAIAVENQSQASVEIGIVPEHLADDGLLPMVGSEDFRIRPEPHKGAVPVLGWLVLGVFFDYIASGEQNLAGAFIAEGLDGKRIRKGIDGFDPDPVEADGFFESLGVVFCAGVDLGSTILELSKRYSSAVIPNRYGVFCQRDLDGFSVAHDVFIDRVVEDFLE